MKQRRAKKPWTRENKIAVAAFILPAIIGIWLKQADKPATPVVPVSSAPSTMQASLISSPLTQGGSHSAPYQMILEVRNAKPYLRASVAKSYVGMQVNWTLPLSAVEEDGTVVLDGKGDIGDAIVVFNTSLAKNAFLKSMKAGEPITVRGMVSEVQQLGSVELDHATIVQ